MSIPTTGTLNINIIFDDEKSPGISNTAEENSSNPIQQGAPNKKSGAKEKGKDSGEKIFSVNQAMNLAQQAASSAVANIGIQTGDYTTQRNIQETMGGIAKAGGMVTALLTGNYVAAAVMAAGAAISAISEIAAMKKQIRDQNVLVAVYARRSGMSSDNNR